MMRIFYYYLFSIVSISIIMHAGNNLPQIRKEISIRGKDHLQIKKYFNPLVDPPEELDKNISTLLLNFFPTEYKKGCKEMISQWGLKSKDKYSTVVRALNIKNYNEKLQYVFLVYTCFSSAEGFGDKYYDERLAVLSIGIDSSKLVIVPNSKTCDNCTDLTKIGLEENNISIGDSPAICVIFGSSDTNPCCESNVKTEETVVKYYLVERNGVREVLSITKNRTEAFHNTERGDSTNTYTAELSTEKDPKGNISRITIEGKGMNGNNPTRSMMWYTWNRKARRFEEGVR